MLDALGGVISEMSLKSFLFILLVSVFSTTRISTRSRSYQKFELRSKDLVDLLQLISIIP
jgi:hypothetical protein